MNENIEVAPCSYARLTKIVARAAARLVDALRRRYVVHLVVQRLRDDLSTELVDEIDPNKWVVSKLTMHESFLCQNFTNFRKFEIS